MGVHHWMRAGAKLALHLMQPWQLHKIVVTRHRTWLMRRPGEAAGQLVVRG